MFTAGSVRPSGGPALDGLAVMPVVKLLAASWTLVLTVWVLATRQPPWLKTVAAVTFGVVVLQGVLGGIRVRMDARLLAVILRFKTRSVIIGAWMTWWCAPPSRGHSERSSRWAKAVLERSRRTPSLYQQLLPETNEH